MQERFDKLTMKKRIVHVLKKIKHRSLIFNLLDFRLAVKKSDGFTILPINFDTRKNEYCTVFTADARYQIHHDQTKL